MLAGSKADRPTDRFPARRLVAAALVLALVPGFGYGALLLGTLALGQPVGAWWPAAVQAHGHALLFGWAGMMVLGVGLHFLPRLRGADLVWPGLIVWVLLLVGGGAAIRVVLQPLLALTAGADVDGLIRVGLALAALAELAGFSLAITMLAWTARRGPPLRQRAGLMAIWPFLVVTFASLWLGSAMNAANVLVLATTPAVLVSPVANSIVIYLMLLGFLVPICVAVSARTFPLYLWVPVPSSPRLFVGLGLLALGLAGQVAFVLGAPAGASAAGWTSIGVGLIWLAVAVNAFARQRPPPRARAPGLTANRATALLIVSAYGWLVIAGLVALALAGARAFGVSGPPESAFIHIVAVGFVSQLIFGMGFRLLPGFGNAPEPTASAAWAVAVLALATTLARLAPLLAPWLFGISSPFFLGLGSAAGLLAIAAIVLFARSVRPALR